MKTIKEKQKLYYDRRHVKELPRLDVGDPVRVAPPDNSNTKEWKPATVVEQHEQPRSYSGTTGNISDERTVTQTKYQNKIWKQKVIVSLTLRRRRMERSYVHFCNFSGDTKNCLFNHMSFDSNSKQMLCFLEVKVQ